MGLTPITRRIALISLATLAALSIFYNHSEIATSCLISIGFIINPEK